MDKYEQLIHPLTRNYYTNNFYHELEACEYNQQIPQAECIEIVWVLGDDFPYWSRQVATKEVIEGAATCCESR